MKEIFNVAAIIAEKYCNEMLPFLHEAKIFHFPGKAHVVFKDDPVLSPTPDPVDVRFLFDTFFLPFRVTAIDDGAGMCIFVDLKEDATGLDSPRMFLNCEWVHPQFDNQFEDGASSELAELARHRKELDLYTLSISCGIIAKSVIDETTNKIQYAVKPAWMMLASPETCYQPKTTLPGDMDKADHDGYVYSVGKNVGVSLSEVYYFNRPGRFVLQESPRKVRKATSFKRVVRTPERPKYTLLYPNEIKAKLGLTGTPAQGTVGTKTPHERRRHFRTLSSERFIHMKGKQIIIPAMWIGPSEAQVGNKHYKVMLDL